MESWHNHKTDFHLQDKEAEDALSLEPQAAGSVVGSREEQETVFSSRNNAVSELNDENSCSEPLYDDHPEDVSCNFTVTDMENSADWPPQTQALDQGQATERTRLSPNFQQEVTVTSTLNDVSDTLNRKKDLTQFDSFDDEGIAVSTYGTDLPEMLNTTERNELLSCDSLNESDSLMQDQQTSPEKNMQIFHLDFTRKAKNWIKGNNKDEDSHSFDTIMEWDKHYYDSRPETPVSQVSDITTVFTLGVEDVSTDSSASEEYRTAEMATKSESVNSCKQQSCDSQVPTGCARKVSVGTIVGQPYDGTIMPSSVKHFEAHTESGVSDNCKNDSKHQIGETTSVHDNCVSGQTASDAKLTLSAECSSHDGSFHQNTIKTNDNVVITGDQAQEAFSQQGPCGANKLDIRPTTNEWDKNIQNSKEIQLNVLALDPVPRKLAGTSSMLLNYPSPGPVSAAVISRPRVHCCKCCGCHNTSQWNQISTLHDSMYGTALPVASDLSTDVAAHCEYTAGTPLAGSSAADVEALSTSMDPTGQIDSTLKMQNQDQALPDLPVIADHHALLMDPQTCHAVARRKGVLSNVMKMGAQSKRQSNLGVTLQTIAPALDINLPYHVCFVYHNNDRDWVLNVIEKLESPNLGFKCCCHERDFDMGLSFIQKIFQGIKNSQRTVIVLSPDFVTNMWNQCESQVLSEMDITLLHKDLVIIMLQECEVPTTLSELPCIDAGVDDWWSKLLVVLCSSDDTPMTEETIVPMSPSLVGLNPNLQSGHLLMSCKSKCGCCGKEYVDPTEVPDDLMAHGIQIPHEEYTKAMKHLLSDSRFRCHMWCYNVPLAMVFFTFLLAICLAVIPLVETKLIFRGSETGLEFVHGTVVWLCALTVYLLVTHISKRKFKDNTYRRLSHVNTIFIKYNLLAGVENLGLGDCNKFYLHFFYFEVGPCLAYLQELMANMEECSAYFVNEVVETECSVDLNCEDQSNGNTINSDHMRVLGSTPMTNTNIQNQAEDLLLDNSGEYINLLITKKLEMPRRQRHAQEAPCLCQFVEQKVYKMIV